MKKNNHKKVLFILRIPPPFGGGEIVSQQLHSLLSVKYKFLLIRYKNHNKSKQSKEDPYALLRGIKYVYLSLKEILKVRPDIIYLGIPKTFGSFLRTSLVILFAKLFGKSVYGELHGMSFYFLQNKWKKLYFDFVINKVSKLRVLSNSIKEYLIAQNFKNEVYVISNGIKIPELEKKKNSINYDNIKFLYLGAISKSKGFFRVIDIAKELLKQGINNWSIDVIGEWVDEDEKIAVIDTINSTGLLNKMNLMGIKIGIDKWNFIIKNDVLIHLTENDGQPLTVIETMGVGIPTISTKVGAIPEMIEDRKSGFLVNNKSEAFILIRDICQQKYDIMSISEYCKCKYYKEYTNILMAENIEKMINE